MLIRTPGACALPLKVSRNTVGHDDFSTVDLPMERHVPAGKTVVTKQFMTKPILICAPRVKSRVISDRHISTHAPRVGSDSRARLTNASVTRFQSTLPVWGATIFRPPLSLPFGFQSTLPVWGATTSGCWRRCTIRFQSTLPVWGATVSGCRSGRLSNHFNPRSPCGERL